MYTRKAIHNFSSLNPWNSQCLEIYEYIIIYMRFCNKNEKYILPAFSLGDMVHNTVTNVLKKMNNSSTIYRKQDKYICFRPPQASSVLQKMLKAKSFRDWWRVYWK